jgi:hypothetical protein
MDRGEWDALHGRRGVLLGPVAGQPGIASRYCCTGTLYTSRWGVSEEEREYENHGYITAQKIIIWKKETGEYPKMSLSGLRDFCEGRES